MRSRTETLAARDALVQSLWQGAEGFDAEYTETLARIDTLNWVLSASEEPEPPPVEAEPVQGGLTAEGVASYATQESDPPASSLWTSVKDGVRLAVDRVSFTPNATMTDILTIPERVVAPEPADTEVFRIPASAEPAR